MKSPQKYSMKGKRLHLTLFWEV